MYVLKVILGILLWIVVSTATQLVLDLTEANLTDRSCTIFILNNNINFISGMHPKSKSLKYKIKTKIQN